MTFTRIDDRALSTGPNYPPPVTPAGPRVSGARLGPFRPRRQPWLRRCRRQMDGSGVNTVWLAARRPGRLPDVQAGAAIHFSSSSLVPPVCTGPRHLPDTHLFQSPAHLMEPWAYHQSLHPAGETQRSRGPTVRVCIPQGKRRCNADFPSLSLRHSCFTPLTCVSAPRPVPCVVSPCVPPGLTIPGGRRVWGPHGRSILCSAGQQTVFLSAVVY